MTRAQIVPFGYMAKPPYYPYGRWRAPKLCLLGDKLCLLVDMANPPYYPYGRWGRWWVGWLVGWLVGGGGLNLRTAFPKGALVAEKSMHLYEL